MISHVLWPAARAEIMSWSYAEQLFPECSPAYDRDVVVPIQNAILWGHFSEFYGRVSGLTIIDSAVHHLNTCFCMQWSPLMKRWLRPMTHCDTLRHDYW